MNLFSTKPRKLSELKERLTLPFDQAKKRASILVIDDDETAFPVELLRSEGYNIQQWTILKNLRDLEAGQFDIIILDIYGICPKGFSKNDGLGVLEHLKNVNPAQIVIAYSGKKFDLQQEKFWRIADDYLGKPTDMLVAKAKIDTLLREKFTAERYWHALADYLRTRGIPDEKIAALESAVARAAAKEKTLKESDVAGLLRAGRDIISTSWIIVQVILRFASAS
jgi:DNA-binding response OmpR family regulator